MKEKENTVYNLHRSGNAKYLTFTVFDRYPGIVHLFATRHGGVSEGCCTSWNFGAKRFDSETNIRQNFEILAEIMGTKADRMVLSSQTHTANIKVVTSEDCGKGVTRERDYEDVDGLVTNVPGIPIITTHADCNSIFAYDPQENAIGLAHSGWRGTLGGIGGELLFAMEKEYSCRPENVIIGLGPALCQDCFEVDEDVAEMFFEADKRNKEAAYGKGAKYYIDLKKIIKQTVSDCGVETENIYDMRLCTMCNTDLFFSHRGQKGRRGTMAAAMMIK